MRKLNLLFNPLIHFSAPVLLCLLALPAFGQMDNNYRNFRDWDVNNNQRLSVEEFYKGASRMETFDTWDDDRNGVLEQGELRTGIYKKWEMEGENFETGDEARVRTWGRFYAGTFDDWDTNGDGTITNAEYSERVGNENRKQLGDRMDMDDDGKVMKEEFYKAIFTMWDEDEDGFLSQQEYQPDEFDSWFL